MSTDKQEPSKTSVLGCGPITGLPIFLGVVGAALAPTKPQGEQAKPTLVSKSEARFTDDISIKLYAETVVKERLRDPGSAEFSDLKVYWAEGGKSATVCGYVNSRNGFGGMSGQRAFITSSLVIIQGDLEPTEFQKVWSALCTSKPAQADAREG